MGGPKSSRAQPARPAQTAEAAEAPIGRRTDVLRVVQAATAPIGIIEIADRLAIHPNTVRFHLDTLISEGRVEHVAPLRKGRGRPPLMFAAVRQMDRGGLRRYQVLAEIFAMGFASDRDPATKALAAGRAWGQRMEPPPGDGAVGAEESIDHLVEMLDELGFAPERREADGEQQVGLRHCPFLELAEGHPSVICPVHMGLMQGALETWRSPVAVGQLDPFAEPDLCVAHLTAIGAAT